MNACVNNLTRQKLLESSQAGLRIVRRRTHQVSQARQREFNRLGTSVRHERQHRRACRHPQKKPCLAPRRNSVHAHWHVGNRYRWHCCTHQRSTVSRFSPLCLEGAVEHAQVLDVSQGHIVPSSQPLQIYEHVCCLSFHRRRRLVASPMGGSWGTGGKADKTRSDLHIANWELAMTGSYWSSTRVSTKGHVHVEP